MGDGSHLHDEALRSDGTYYCGVAAFLAAHLTCGTGGQRQMDLYGGGSCDTAPRG